MFLFICFPQILDSFQVIEFPDTVSIILRKINIISVLKTKIRAINNTPSNVRINRYKIIHVYKYISYTWNVIIIVTMMFELSFHALYIIHYIQ